MFAIIASLFLAALPPGHSSSEWEYMTSDADQSDWYVRTEDYLNGRSDQTNAYAWVLLDSRKDRTVRFSYVKSLYRINCPAQTYITLQSTYYYADGSNRSSNYGRLTVAVPGSVMAEIVANVCADPTPPPAYNRT